MRESTAPNGGLMSPIPCEIPKASIQLSGFAIKLGPQSNGIGRMFRYGSLAVEPDEHAESMLPDSGIILVARLPVEVRASPSSSAPALYGFPAGRPFRVIGREGGFAHIQDLKSSASGWIDEVALAQPPDDPATSSSAQPQPYSAEGKPGQRNSGVTADSEVTTPPNRKRPGLFGRGGLFGRIFGN